MTTTMDCSPLHLVCNDFAYVVMDRSQILYLRYRLAPPAPLAEEELSEEQRQHGMEFTEPVHQIELVWKDTEQVPLWFRTKEWKCRTDVDRFLATLFPGMEELIVAPPPQFTKRH